MSRFLPPMNLAMTTLNRSLFQKTFPITAAHVFDEKNIGRVMEGCKEDLLRSGNAAVKIVIIEEGGEGCKEEGSTRKMLVRMKPTVKHDGMNCNVVFALLTDRPQLTVGQISPLSVERLKSSSTAGS